MHVAANVGWRDAHRARAEGACGSPRGRFSRRTGPSRRFAFAVVVSAAWLAVLPTFGAEARRHFFAPTSIDVRQLLSGPPAEASTVAQQDLATVLALQSSRTAADAARASHEGTWSPFLFADVFGAWFTAEKLPATIALLDIAGRDTMAVCDGAKKFWFRPRPPLVDKRVHPCVGLPANSSYPSAHGAYGVVLATVLTELAPDLEDKLRARGRQIGDDRVLGGVHFPSDVEAGRSLAPVILERLHGSPAFRAALGAAKLELQRVRVSSAAAPATTAAPTR